MTGDIEDPNPSETGTISVMPTTISRMAPEGTATIKVWIDGVRKLDPASESITFTSSDTDVATVSTAGVITAVAPGDATITVTTGSKSATGSVAIQ